VRKILPCDRPKYSMLKCYIAASEEPLIEREPSVPPFGTIRLIEFTRLISETNP